MPISFSIDPWLELIHIRATGVLSDADVVELRPVIEAHEDLRPHFRQLVDMRAVRGLNVTPGTVPSLGRTAAFGGRCAIVAAAPVVYGMARMYGLYRSAETEIVRVFDDHDGALAWLGLDPTDVAGGK